jgi:hypothetical protein
LVPSSLERKTTEVDDELEFARLHDREIAGLLAFEDAASIDAGLAVRVGQASGVSHEAAAVDKFARSKNGGDPVLLRQSADSGGGSLEESVAGDDERPHIAFDKTGKGRIEIALVARLCNVKFKAKTTNRCLHLAGVGRVTRVVGVDQNTEHGGLGDEVMQEADLLLQQLCGEERNPGDVPAGTVETGDETQLYRIATDAEHYRNGCRRRLRRGRRETPDRGDHRHATANQLRGQRREFPILIARPQLDRNVATFDVAGFAQAIMERGRPFGARAIEDTDHRHRRLLRPRRERPRGSRGAKQYKFAPFHCPMPPVPSDRKDSTPRLRQETAALRDFNPPFVRCGSLATEEVEAALPSMSALLRKRTNNGQSRCRRRSAEKRGSKSSSCDVA